MEIYQLSPEEAAECKKAFEFLDGNKDGVICTSELSSAMEAIGLHPTEAELQDMIRRVDSNGNGTLDFDGFQSLMILEVKKTELDALRAVFRTFDMDNDGSITPQEVRQGLKKAGIPCEETEIRLAHLFREADFNKDGKIDIEGKWECFLSTCGSHR